MNGKLFNSLLARYCIGSGGIALSGNKLLNKSNQELIDSEPKLIQQISDEPQLNTNKSVSNTVTWINDIAIPFIISWEGKVLDDSGNHVIYDDDVNAKVKRKWDRKTGGQKGINNFIESCKGKPTIGYR